MKKLLLLLFSASFLYSAVDRQTEKEVMAAMDALRKAHMGKDRAALEKVFHNDLSYAHSNGLIETKAQAVQHISTSKAIYEDIDITNTTVRAYGNVALVTCTTDIRENVEGKKNVNHLVVLLVWLKGPQGWQLVGRQSTRPPAP